jgi:putative transposase
LDYLYIITYNDIKIGDILIQIKGYLVELNPNKKQISLLLQSSAVHRKAYNYALGKAENYFKENGKYPSLKEIQDLNKDFTTLKAEDPNYNWYNDVSKCCHQLAIFDLKDAFSRFYKGQNRKPNFKSIFKTKKRFHFDNVGIKISRHSIKIPKVGYVGFKEFGRIPFKDVKFNNFTVSLRGNRWYLSVSVEREINIEIKDNLPIIGIDLGIKDLITCSNNRTYNISKTTKIKINFFKNRHIRYQRKLSKQVKGSKNRSKTRKLMAVNYKKICNIKSDAIHKITTDIAKRSPKIIVVEDLAIINLLKNHKLANSISDCSFGEILRQLEYKSYSVGGNFYHIDRFYPSSKTCSCCGNIKHDLKLSDRIYYCDKCCLKINRDLNAAFNIKSYYIRKVRSVGSELQALA